MHFSSITTKPCLLIEITRFKIKTANRQQTSLQMKSKRGSNGIKYNNYCRPIKSRRNGDQPKSNIGAHVTTSTSMKKKHFDVRQLRHSIHLPLTKQINWMNAHVSSFVYLFVVRSFACAVASFIHLVIHTPRLLLISCAIRMDDFCHTCSVPSCLLFPSRCLSQSVSQSHQSVSQLLWNFFLSQHIHVYQRIYFMPSIMIDILIQNSTD